MKMRSRTVLYKTKSLDGIKLNTNPKTKTKTNPNTNPNPKLTEILTLYSCFMLFRAPSPDLQSSRLQQPWWNVTAKYHQG